MSSITDTANATHKCDKGLHDLLRRQAEEVAPKKSSAPPIGRRGHD